MKLLLLTFILFNNPKEVEYRKLTWNDFKGPIVNSSTAETTTQLQLDWVVADGKYTFKVTAWFLPYESFTITDRLDVLRHEQGHMDLAQTKALQCMKALVPYKWCSESRKRKAEAIYAHYVKSLNELQALYDKETKHSQNVVIQKKWEANIKEGLRRLE